MSRSHRKLELPDPSIKDHTRDLGVRSVKSAQRVLELFEIFEQLEEPISLADLVRISEIPQSSAWMLVQTLLRMGYICQNPVDKTFMPSRSEEHTSELQSRGHLVCRLLLEKKNSQF